MATMIKEKKREKKKSKNINISKTESNIFLSKQSREVESSVPTSIISEEIKATTSSVTEVPNKSEEISSLKETESLPPIQDAKSYADSSLSNKVVIDNVIEMKEDASSLESPLLHNQEHIVLPTNDVRYLDLNDKLQEMIINSKSSEQINIEKPSETAQPLVYISKEIKNIEDMENIVEEVTEIEYETSQTNIDTFEQVTLVPSAPIMEDSPIFVLPKKVISPIEKPKVKAIPIEEAMKLYGGKEIAEVKAMSEREEAAVEAGPVSGPEHPLVDLLSTFRSSLIAVERERTQLALAFKAEAKSRDALWKIEKRSVRGSEPCSCGATVSVQAYYEHAELMKDKLPVAKLRLEGLLRDVQDCYCHHQHSSLLAYCQIEEFIHDTLQSGSKPDIREALALVLQVLRLSDPEQTALSSALQRWASALAAGLVDARDLRQLLYLIHHLFRQTRSVQWAARVIRLNVIDNVSAIQVIALLDILIARPGLETAMECTEETEEAWEEVDKYGSGSAVSEGTLRERDLMSLLHAFPLRDLVARIVLFTHSDIKQCRDYDWGDAFGGRGVIKAACGVRTLLCTLQRAATAHAQYTRLLTALRSLAANALYALACLHLHSRDTYLKDLETKIIAELEASFVSGLRLFGPHEVYNLPATLLSPDTAMDYCITHMITLHDKSRKRIESMSIDIPAMDCATCMRIVAQASIDRLDDHGLARNVLEFLVQTGIKRKTVSCTCTSEVSARELLPKLLAAHTYLYGTALHVLADLNQSEPLDTSSVLVLSVHAWRPNGDDIRAVLEDWSQRCTQLLQHLLLQLDYTPHSGLSLKCQLCIGSWLCQYIQSLPHVPPEWTWLVLRRLRVHRTHWAMSLDAPCPDDIPSNLFSKAYALLSSSWGHSIPLICSEGVSALCTLSSQRPREAVHCLSHVMLVMAHSPESLSLTPKFIELFAVLLSSGPTLVQRALGRGGVTGSELLLQLILGQLEQEQVVSPASLLSVWMHALWHDSLPPASLSILDTALVLLRDHSVVNTHAAALAQEDNAKNLVEHVIRNASVAPWLCEHLLRATHLHCETRGNMFPLLLHALAQQQAARRKIHVDRALQQLSANINAEELVVYRSAAAAMVVPVTHPAHLALWRLFMHLYLQRPPDYNMQNSPAIGPLFYSGIIKSRMLAQIKKRLQETASYHQNEAKSLKTIQNKSVEPTSSRQLNKSTKTIDNGLFSALSIADMTGESDSDAEETLSEQESEIKEVKFKGDNNTECDSLNLLRYHVGAEKMVREYLRWLDEGDKVRALPFHSDIARFITDDALETAWQLSLSKLRPPSTLDLDSPSMSPLMLYSIDKPPNSQTPFNNAVDTILKIEDCSRKKYRKTIIRSLIQDVDFKNTRIVMNLVDKHLKDIETLAEEWCKEVSRIQQLDTKLWEYVGALRVRRPLPTVMKQCPNKCKPVTVHMQEYEWTISSGAERSIQENRCSAVEAIRRLSRARPQAARTTAALQAIARRINNTDAAVRVVDRVWRCASAAACEGCGPAKDALMALTDCLAERWICAEGAVCAELLSRWAAHGSTSLQHALCGALVSPRRLRTQLWPAVYTALMRLPTLPAHTLFSYLSRFEMSRWSEIADPSQRRDVLEALVNGAQHWSSAPPSQCLMVIELLGVHTRAIINATELCAHILRCTEATIRGNLPPQYWTYVSDAVDNCGGSVPFDQLGHLLRELGVMWWETRTGLKGSKMARVDIYAPRISSLLHGLLQAFVVAALKLSYVPERVGWYAWSAIQESWSPWISPHPAAPPLLPCIAGNETFCNMLKQFVASIQQVMIDCPGTEIQLLQQVFNWIIQTYVTINGTGSNSTQESRLQFSALLTELSQLPWGERQWCCGTSLDSALQISTSADKEITSWCSQVWSNTVAATWLRDTNDEQMVPKLASLLYLFTASNYQHTHQTLDEACSLPWWRLPESALDEALDRFFMVHHKAAQPYHDLPQFRVILFVTQLSIHQSTPSQLRLSTRAYTIRSRSVCSWVRAACEPALISHVPAHSTFILRTLTALAPYMEESSREIEELLSRAVVIMCMEPAAAAALPVWQHWISNTTARMVVACLSATSVLTVFKYFASLAEAAVKAHLRNKESSGWLEVESRWGSCPWQEAHSAVVAGSMHVAYGLLLAHPHSPRQLRTTFNALLTIDIQSAESAPMIAVWICYICRVCRESDVACPESVESAQAGRNVLNKWADPPRRSILKMVAGYMDYDKCAAHRRLLCRLAQCILNPSEETSRAYETACSVLGSNPGDVTTWGKSPHPSKLSRLALRLYPQYEVYFTSELSAATGGE